ncbi:hypothetical protein FRC00_013346, partial [Tulasnella sp. 408]
MDMQRDSGEQVRPPEGDLPPPPKVAVDAVPGEPAAATVADVFLPPTPSLLSDFPSVPDLFHDIEKLMNGTRTSPLPSPRTLPSPRRHLPDPIDPDLPVPVPSSTDPSPPKTASTIQPSRPTTTTNATATTVFGMSPLKIAEKTTTLTPALTAPRPPAALPRLHHQSQPQPQPPSRSHHANPAQVPVKSPPLPPAINSPTFSDDVLSPIEYRPNPLMKNPAATASTLSFSSMSSAGAGRSRVRSRPQQPIHYQQDDDVVDEDSDIDVVDLRSRSSSRRRRGSEPASPRPRVGMDDTPMGSSFGAFGTHQSILSSTPPSAFPGGPNGVVTSKKRSIPNAAQSSLYQRTRTPSTGSTKSRNLYNFMSNLASSSTSVSEEGGVGGSASSCGPANGRGTPSSAVVSSAASATSSNGPKRMRSFNYIPLPPIPALRHCNSFNPSLSTASESNTPASSVGASPAAQKIIHTSASTSNLSMTSSVKTEVAPTRKPSTSSKRKILRQSSSKASLSHSRPSTSGSISVGPLGEIVDYEHDWSKQRTRYPRDDDTRSLMTLNRPLGNASLDGHGESQDEMPSSYNESFTSPTEP